MKNPKLIVKPFAKNGQKNVIPENYETSMESNQATWDQGFGQITMLPVAAGGLPPKGQDFNGIFNQISENIVYLSQGGRFKFSAEYAEAIGGYPKGAILQSDDEKKEYLSLIDNNKVDFNTASDISTSWKLVNTDDLLAQIASKQPKGDYATKTELNSGLAGKQPVGDYATKTEVGLKLDKTAVVQSPGTSETNVMSQKAATDLASRKLDKTDGGKILAPISVSGRRVNSGILVVDTMTDGNSVGDGQTQLGYNSGTEDKPVFNHYLRGSGSVFVDTGNGLTALGDIKSQKSIIPKDYTNFDSRFLQLSNLGDKTGQVPDMGLFLASLGFQGWQSLPSLDGSGNLILQWGSFGQFKAGEGVTVTFRKPFPSHCVFAIAITVRPSTSTTTQEAAYLAEKSATSARFTKGGTETSDGVWLALGY